MLVQWHLDSKLFKHKRSTYRKSCHQFKIWISTQRRKRATKSDISKTQWDKPIKDFRYNRIQGTPDQRWVISSTMAVLLTREATQEYHQTTPKIWTHQITILEAWNHHLIPNPRVEFHCIILKKLVLNSWWARPWIRTSKTAML